MNGASTTRRTLLALALLPAVALSGWWLGAVVADQLSAGDPLPRLGDAPDLTLTTHDGAVLSLTDLRGKVLAITFIYTNCGDTCPLVTLKLQQVRDRLGSDFASRVAFLSITVDPEHDTPDVLRLYAEARGLNAPGWIWLTGSPLETRQVARAYGVAVRPGSRGDVDHTFLTSLVDRRGSLRVQYAGVRFDADEFLGDIRSLLRERT